ncbi:hypothetical protein DFJ73DRAFT_839236 [Zopfochytrium polystomum]|nr:hypothetical protein DFJ73DRAFT_839236 [Zopfochytrium polystomum]
MDKNEEKDALLSSLDAAGERDDDDTVDGSDLCQAHSPAERTSHLPHCETCRCADTHTHQQRDPESLLCPTSTRKTQTAILTAASIVVLVVTIVILHTAFVLSRHIAEMNALAEAAAVADLAEASGSHLGFFNEGASWNVGEPEGYGGASFAEVPKEPRPLPRPPRLPVVPKPTHPGSKLKGQEAQAVLPPPAAPLLAPDGTDVRVGIAEGLI